MLSCVLLVHRVCVCVPPVACVQVELMQGSIELQSEVNIGSCFKFDVRVELKVITMRNHSMLDTHDARSDLSCTCERMQQAHVWSLVVLTCVLLCCCSLSLVCGCVV